LASLYIESGEEKFVWCAHVHLPGYVNANFELPLPHMNLFSVSDVSCRQVFTVGICITVAYEAVSFTEMYAVRGCES